MKGLPSSTPVGLDCFRAIFQDYLQRWTAQEVILRVPDCAAAQRLEATASRVFHFQPELFLQVQGTTVFDTPGGSVSVGPGEIALVPAGVPHAETIAHEAERPFGNLVVGFFNGNVSVHLGQESAPGVPAVAERFLFWTDRFSALVQNLELIAVLQQAATSRSRQSVRGLMQGVLCLLVDVLETESFTEASDSAKVVQSKWIISENLSNSDLSVGFLSEQLGCNPNYLSRLFHQKAGEKLTDYITKTRLRYAMNALIETDRSVKDVARICGFSDPNYFARVFRQYIGCSPHAYRKQERTLRERISVKGVGEMLAAE
ncbi:MAG: AraC family transcriptional regulator [Verrucomicrobiota bacterium JB022]|nr:AraC family transcriptional regulator [Verrucomicrobiota bacterium JB022]